MKHNGHVGLNKADVLERQKKYGLNEVVEESTAAWERLLKKFIAPIPLMIEFALVLSAVVHRWEDFSIILVLLTVNIGVDIIQEHKASKALAALTEVMAETATVLRDNRLYEINAKELVPGDIVKLSIGDIAPADLRLLDDTVITVDQSAITGESLPVEIQQEETLLSSAIIQNGSGYTEVVATGTRTNIGTSASLVAKAEREESGHFQKAILKIGKFLIIIAIALVVISSAVLLLRGEDMTETIRFAIVLTIASIPVALPAVLSVTMALGANALARRNAIVSDFKAVEELAGVDQLCIDKTGTLTKNSIAAFAPTLYNSFTEKELYLYILFALEEELSTPIEKALHRHAIDEGYDTQLDDYELLSFTPFDPEHKVTEAVVKNGRAKTHIVLGAPQKVADLLKNKQSEQQLEDDVSHYAAKGFRSIALAVKTGGRKYHQLVGIVPLMDPARDDAREAIQEIHDRGISIKMLTGDNHAIADFIAKQLHIGTRLLTSVRTNLLRKENPAAFHKTVCETDVFTEVVPADKYHIIESLQQNNHIVAMTGDGVNDAPALKKADIGIAVAGATAAARKASDIVLLDSTLSVIKDAIDSARRTFARMESYATFRISETIRVVFFIAISVMLYEFSPVTAVMIILLALLNDIPVLAISYDNVPTAKKPVRWEMRKMLIVACVLGVSGVISSFLLLHYLYVTGVAVAVIQTIIFLKLDVAGHSTLYLTRTRHRHFWERPYPALKFFLPAFSSRILGTIIAYFGIFMPAISFSTIVAVWIYATIWFIINDFIKVWTYRVLDTQHPQPKPSKLTDTCSI